MKENTFVDIKDLANKTIRSASWQTISVSVRAIAELLITAILSRLITPEEFGLVAASNVCFTFFYMFAEMGLGASVIQRKEIDKGFEKVAFTLSTLVGIVISFLAWLSAPLFSAFFGSHIITEIIKWLSLTIMISSLGTVSRSLLARTMDFRKLMYIDVLSYLLGYAVIGVIFAFLNYGVWAIVFARITQTLMQTILLLIIRPQKLTIKPRSGEVHSILFFGSGLTLSRLFNNLANQGDYLVIGRTLGNISLGLYERAFRLMTLPAVYLGNVIDAVLFPALSRVQENKQHLRIAYKSLSGAAASVLFIISAWMIAFAPEIVNVILGQNWTEVINPLRILLISLPLRTSVRISDSLIRSCGAVYWSAFNKFLYSLAIILFSLIGACWGLIGVSIGVGFANLLNFVFMSILTSKLIKTDFLSISIPFLQSSLMGIISLILAYFIKMFIYIFSSYSIFILLFSLIIGIPCQYLIIRILRYRFAGDYIMPLLERMKKVR